MKTIIVIDDQYFVLQSLKRMLRNEAYDIKTALNGYDGILLIRKYIPDLIIMDLNMPVMSGQDAIKEIKKDKTLSKIPIIVLTGFTDIDNIIKLYELGIKDVVRKPYDQKDLYKRIKMALGEAINEDNSTVVVERISETQKILRKTKIGKAVQFTIMDINKVKPGMTLGSDLKLNNQIILIPYGTILTNDLINKIKKLNITNIPIAKKEKTDEKSMST